MAIEVRGRIHMKGDDHPGLGVTVRIDEDSLRLLSGEEVVGDWRRGQLGIHALHEGFVIRAEGEEIVLRTENDAAVAEELGMVAATPRLARKVAASHPPEERPSSSSALTPGSYLGEIALALGGVLVVAGGFLLRAISDAGSIGDAGDYWIPFVTAGSAMVASAYFVAAGVSWGRPVAWLSLLASVVVFGLAAQSAATDALISYAFAAAGTVIGIAVVFSGTLGGDE